MNVTKYTAEITTIYQDVNQVGFVTKGDAQERRAQIVTTDVAWRWPVVGETWLVKQENGSWYLDSVLPVSTYDSVTPGDAIINSPTGVIHIIGSDDGSTDFTLSALSAGSLGDVTVNGTPVAGEVLTATSPTAADWQLPTGSSGGGTVTVRTYRAAAFTTTASTWVKIPLDTKSFDTSGMADVTTNHRINITTAGYYQVDAKANASSTAANEGCAVAVYKNGVLITQGSEAISGGSGEAMGSSASDIISCNAGDYLELWVNTYAVAAALNVAVYDNFLSAILLASLPGAVGTTTVAKAYRKAAYTLAAGWNAVPIDTVENDPAGHFDLTNHRYTVPATGTYLVTGGCMVNVGTANANVAEVAGIYVNGSIRTEGARQGQTDTTGMAATFVSDILNLNAGDTIQLYQYSNGGWPLYVTNNSTNSRGIDCYLSVVEVGNSMNFTTAGGALTGTYPNPTLAQVTSSAWITPTLINSWTGADGYGYLKDPLGFVHLRGAYGNGTAATVAFVLPAGYRPGVTTYYPILLAGGVAGGYVHIDTSGNVAITNSGTAWLTAVTFLAEN